MPGPAIVVHGGAGTAGATARRRAGVGLAATAAWAELARGGTALDAVVAAVVILEDDPCFNAGYGSVLTAEGRVEMDASIMEGDHLRAGAVAVVRTVPNPIRLARAVLDAGREVLLVGRPAERLARTAGLRTVPPAALVPPATRRRWANRGETVGAVARDARGHVAAATSTGGLAGKRSGRVGDSAVIGAGTYADDALGAGSATGPGEAIIRAALIRSALGLVAAGATPAAASRAVLRQLGSRLEARAGLILVDPAGRIGLARTTPAMAAAWRTHRMPRVATTD